MYTMTKKHIDCAKGCSFCCMIRAHVAGDEKDRVLKALMEMPNQDVALKRAEHREKMDFALAGGLAPCVALAPDGTCQIYESRPETCRTYFSTDKRECEKGSLEQNFDPKAIITDGRKPHSQLAYIDELYLAKVRGESTEIAEIRLCVPSGDEQLYMVHEGKVYISSMVKKFVDKLPKELGSAVIASADHSQFVSVTLYSKQVQIELSV